jgi:hypothetical protein
MKEGEHSGIKPEFRNSKKTPSVFVIKINTFNYVSRDNRHCENHMKYIHSTRARGKSSVFSVTLGGKYSNH